VLILLVVVRHLCVYVCVCVAGRLITRVDEACLSLSLLFSVRERTPGIFFFLLVFFTTISVLHIWTRLLASEGERESEERQY
jgi:hypothetical protein